MPLKIDLHVHTYYSYDSITTPKDLVFYARKQGLDGLAITDHDTIDGVSKMRVDTDLIIIPGMEITSSNGHIIALNIRQPISKGLGVDETLDKIHEAGGIAVACHPMALFKGSLRKQACSRFDAIEVVNASAFPFNYSVKNARQLATDLQIAQVAGSDAHYGPEIGYAYTLIDSESQIDEVAEAICKARCQPSGKAIPWSLRLRKELLMLRKESPFQNR